MHPIPVFRWLSVVLVVSSAVLALAGCSKSSSRPAAMSSPVFDSAPAGVKEHWQSAGNLAAKGDYPGAVSNLTAIFEQSQSLTTEQKDALQQAWLDIGNQAFKAANDGNKKALEAVQQMRASPYGKVQGQR